MYAAPPSQTIQSLPVYILPRSSQFFCKYSGDVLKNLLFHRSYILREKLQMKN